MASFAKTDSATLPVALQQQLHTLQQKDDLEKWLYARIDYVDAAPIQRISFLMQTQQAAWRKYKTYEERLAWFNLLILQGYYQLQTGNILLSINAYEAALEFYEAYPLPDADIISYVLKPLGNNYTRLADYNTALYIHRKTLALALQKKDRSEVAATYSNMAICARWKGELIQAMQYVKDGMAAAKEKTPIYGLLMITRADILTEQEKYDTAAKVIFKAFDHFEHYGKDTSVAYWISSCFQMSARIGLKQGKSAFAIRHAHAAELVLEKYFPKTRQRERARIQVLMGDAWLQGSNPREALLHYQQSLQGLLPVWKPGNLQQVPPDSILYSENTLLDALTGKAQALQQLGYREAALEHYMTVFTAAATLRAAFFYTASKLQELQTVRERAGAAMQLAYALWQETHQKKYQETLLLIAELSKAQLLAEERAARTGALHSTADSMTRKIKQLQDAVIYYQHELATAPGNKRMQELLQEAEYELALRNKDQRRQDGVQAAQATLLTLAQVHHIFQQLPPNVTALELFEGRDSSYLIEMDTLGISSIRVIANSTLLHDTVQQYMKQWYTRGPSAMMNAPKQFYQESYYLYNALFGNYQWHADRHYLLIPDGVFCYLPFDALLTSNKYSNNYADWPWLFKTATLSQAYSLFTWQQQQAASYKGQTFTGFFVSQGKGKQQPVLSVKQEYALLHKNISGQYFVDSSATWQQFNKTVLNTSVLHISTHAVSSTQDSLPYLQLYDQPFYLFDLRYLHFAPSLVVLGACKTADGEWLAGEGVNSLSRGFTAAGAGGVVSGLWNVNDETAIGIIEQFYQQLQQGQDPAQALHRAKQQWLQQHREEATLQLPYYWAGLMYSGHLQPVTVMSNKNYTKYYIAGLLILLGLGIFIGRRIKR